MGRSSISFFQTIDDRPWTMDDSSSFASTHFTTQASAGKVCVSVRSGCVTGILVYHFYLCFILK